jgi:uncharacterized RDD family membrane protein YckC
VTATTVDARGAVPQDGLVPLGFVRRLVAMMYEGVVLFGVVAVVGFLYSTLTQQRHALQGRAGMQFVLFVLIGLYFIWFWTRGGQTVAMKTWHVFLLDAEGRPVRARRALARYLLSWLWFLPALAVAHTAGWGSSTAILGAVAAGVLAYALLSQVLPGRQTLHDLLCGTRLLHRPPAAKAG